MNFTIDPHFLADYASRIASDYVRLYCKDSTDEAKCMEHARIFNLGQQHQPHVSQLIPVGPAGSDLNAAWALEMVRAANEKADEWEGIAAETSQANTGFHETVVELRAQLEECRKQRDFQKERAANLLIGLCKCGEEREALKKRANGDAGAEDSRLLDWLDTQKIAPRWRGLPERDWNSWEVVGKPGHVTVRDAIRAHIEAATRCPHGRNGQPSGTGEGTL